MRKAFLFLTIAILGFATGLQAQKYTITGRVTDDAGEAIIGGSVMLLQAKDSILQSFAITGADGSFKFEGVPVGDFVFKSIYLKHNTFVTTLKVEGNEPQIVMPQVKMVPEASKLADVQITEEADPIRMKGDTIEYDAKSFKTQQGDNVENLLRKLPGVEVDSDGNIKAQGKSVVRVLVDGKDFFGDDPKVASKNLPAEAINKVQVFDKKSEMADFTGVDDGTRDRTINLTLKEEYKKGYFGNVSAGYGTKNRYEGKASLNRFADKSQLSFIGQANNTNQQGFSFQDYMNFMGGMQNMTRENGPRNAGISLGANPNNGFYNTGATGANGNWDVGKKTKISVGYFGNSMLKELERTSTKQTVLDDGTYTTDEIGAQTDFNTNHRANFSIKHDIDSLTKFTLRTNVSGNSTTSDVTNLTTSSLPGGANNSSDQTSTTAGSIKDFNNTLNLMHRFRKKGRSLSLSGTFRMNPQDKTVDLLSLNTFGRDTITYSSDTVHQNQIQSQGYTSYGGTVAYSEPLGKHSVLDGTVNYQQTVNTLDKNFFNLNQAGENPVLDSNLSNSYESIFSYGRGGINWRVFTQRLNINTGLAIQKSQLAGTLFKTNTPINKSFLNILPSFELRYTMSKNQRLDFRYNTRMNEPSITQLQPVRDNSNPLNITVGNPDLGAEYAHNARFNYSLFDQFTFTSFFATMQATYTQNKISSLTLVDSLLRQVTMPVNVRSDMNVNTNLSFSTPIRKLQLKFSTNANSTISRSIVFINGVENYVNRFTQGGDIKIENKKKEHFDAFVGGRTSYTVTTYPTASDLNQSYINSGLFGEIMVFLPKRFTVMTGMDCSIYAGAGFNSNQVVPIWKAYVAKKVFKNGRGEFRVSAYDLLNKNVGITRTATLNYQQQEKSSTLSRYFLGSFSYAIVAIGKKK